AGSRPDRAHLPEEQSTGQHPRQDQSGLADARGGRIMTTSWQAAARTARTCLKSSQPANIRARTSRALPMPAA
ncbi:hypothetical protein, partial [Acinetobacter baumannii]|uniref:hypothetical protein n=1 Tax=Acinetobacter baumannii TaxID=470 RepID=UPI001BB4651D